jgi:sec-independent protein translocase protein TatC
MEDERKEPQAPDSSGMPGETAPVEGAVISTPAEPAQDASAVPEDPYRSDPYISPEPENYGSTQPGQAQPETNAVVPAPSPTTTAVTSVTPPPPPPPSEPPSSDDEDDEEEEGMLRMSFMEHLQELRVRILRALVGVAVAFILSLTFCDPLWRIIQAPATDALKHLGYSPHLVQIAPMEIFSIVWIKMPLLVSLFIGSPWVLYQVWAFISPGLYKKERRWAVPFILCTAGLFIAGGLFAYFVAFRYGLEFLLGIGRNVDIAPMVSVTEYFDLFVNVTLGIAVVFELPIVIFFLTLLHIASPRFLLKNSRYAVLGIVILASIVTPTPDVFNLMLFAVPMCMLFFIGVFASYLLVLKREGRTFPWRTVFLVILGLIVVTAVTGYILITHYGFHLIQKWPFLIR